MRLAWNILLDLTFVLGGKFANLAVVFLGGVLVARLAGPPEYGVFTVAMSLLLLGDGLIGAPLDLSAVRFFALHPGERERSERFEAMTLQLKMICAVVAAVAILSVRSLVRAWWPMLADPAFPLFACVFCLTALLAARSTSTSLQNRQRFRAYSAVDLAQGTVRAAGFLGLAWCHRARATSYLLIYGLAALGVAGTGWLFLRQRYLLGRWPTRLDSVRLLRYSGYAAGIITLSTISGRGDLLLLAAVKGASHVAGYGLASQVALLLTQIAMYASLLTQPRVLKLHAHGTLGKLFLLNLAVVVCLVVMLLAVWSPAVMTQILFHAFGKGFASSVPWLRILLLGVCLDWLIVPVLMVFCLQVCPQRAFLGEIIVTGLFLSSATAAVARTWPWPPEQILAWIAVLGRAAKLILYGTLFLTRNAKPSPAALTSLVPR